MFQIYTKIAFLILFFIFPTFFAYGNNDKNTELIDTQIKFLNEEGKPPIKYVMEKFKTNQIVAIGEYHEVENYLSFLNDLVKDQDFIENVGIIVWEFGNSRFQKKVDKMLNSDKFDKNIIIEMYREHPIPWGWPFECYLNFYRTIWEINRDKKNH